MNIKIFRGKNFTFEQMVFISKFEKWNLARRPKKKLAKILEETKDITKIEI
ncbi:MAG: hypothetical protein QG566_412 [Patescibacteria group bacterium]|nr:hypothetical protein [Patescibacteria group bacterium]